MPPTTLSLFCSTAALRIGAADFSLATLSITFWRMALSSAFPLSCADAFTAGAIAATRDGMCPGGGTATVVTKDEDRRHAEHGDGIFHARDRIVVGEIAGHAADEQVTAPAIEGIFGRDARIRAAQDGRVRVLPPGQCLPLMLEVVAPRRAFDIARISFH